jgi:hypothetical protein
MPMVHTLLAAEVGAPSITVSSHGDVDREAAFRPSDVLAPGRRCGAAVGNLTSPVIFHRHRPDRHDGRLTIGSPGVVDGWLHARINEGSAA